MASSSSQSEQGESTILLAEGLGFGDGGHPTTALCLELLSKLDLSGYKNIFDIGTGSGVLITAAAKRTKQSSLFACDTEKNAMSQTQRTLELNSCAAELYQGDWKALRLESGLVVANLYLSFLEEILRDFSLESFDFLLSGASSSSLRELLKEIQAERHFKQFEFLEREGWAAAFFSA